MSAEETEWDSGSKACSERFSSRDVTSQWSILGALRDRLMAYAKRHCDRGSIVGSFSDIFISKDGQWYVAQKGKRNCRICDDTVLVAKCSLIQLLLKLDA